MMTIHVWTILGGEKARKGSTIRALTGLSRNTNSPFFVKFTNNHVLPFFIKIMSINEDSKSGDPKTWINSLPTSHRLNLLIAIRLDRATTGFTAQDYYEELARQGAIFESIVTLGENTPRWVSDLGVPALEITDNNQPTNAIAGMLRKAWGWY